MGVMECNRNECENIMCDTYTPKGYLCHDCLSELEELYPKTSFKTLKSEWDILLSNFMESSKGDTRIMDIQTYLNNND